MVFSPKWLYTGPAELNLMSEKQVSPHMEFIFSVNDLRRGHGHIANKR